MESDFSNFITLGISFASLLASVAAIVVTWKIYTRYPQQKLTESQLEVVLSLIKSVYDNVFLITTVHNHGKNGMGYSYEHKNLFQLANGGGLPANSQYNYPILLLNSHSFVFKPWTFLANPLLPNAIGQSMQALHDSIIFSPTKTEKFEHYIVIGKRKKKEPEVEMALSEFDGGYSAFLDHCAAIDREIKKWLKAHGLTDLNQHVVSTEYKRWLG